MLVTPEKSSPILAILQIVQWNSNSPRIVATELTELDWSQGRTVQDCSQKTGSLGQYRNIHIFFVIPRFPLKTVQRFRNFLAVLPPPTLYKVETRKKILDTRVQHCLWGEGRGWTCVNWKTPQKRKRVPRLLSMTIVVGLADFQFHTS